MKQKKRNRAWFEQKVSELREVIRQLSRRLSEYRFLHFSVAER
jgi:hypothetical protein